MNERQALRPRVDVRRQRPGEQIAADGKQQIVLIQHFAHAGLGARHRSAIERMRCRKRRGVGDEFDIDRRADGLGERGKLLVRAALRHGIAGDDHRPLSLGQQFGGSRHRVGVAAHPRRDACRFKQIDIGIALENVARQRQEDRSGRRRQCCLDGAVHVARQILDTLHFGGPFDEGPRQGRQVGGQYRFSNDIFEILLARGDQYRRICLRRVVEHAHGIAEARRDMKVQHCEIAGGLRIAVRHRHQGCFLQAQNIADVVLDGEGIHQRQFGGAGIAEHHRDAFLLEQIEKGTFSGHHRQGGLRVHFIAE